MPYIGRELESGNYLKLDDISSSFNGSTTTFNLTAGGKAFFPGSAFSILVNLAGVAQEPEAAYQINNSQITFATAPASGDQFFCIVLGVAHGVNVPGNGTVDGAQLAKPFNYDGFFYLDDANNRVGVGTATPGKPLHVVGEGQFDSVRVLGDLTVDGTTTTLDTVVTEVDKLEVAANNNTVGVAITQSGSGDILNLYDGATEVFTVKDGGKIGIGNADPNAELSVNNASSNASVEITRGASGAEYGYRIFGADGSAQTALKFFPVSNGSLGSEVARFDADGRLLLGATSSGASALADDLVISKAGHTGMTIRSTDSNNSSIYFADGTSGDAQYRGWLEYHHASDTMRFATSAAERMKIDADGKVGIGTNSPQSQFEVYGTSPIVRSKHSTSQKYTQINHDGTDGYVDWSSGNLILRGASNSEKVRITSDGRVSIGFTNPDSFNLGAKLIVKQTGADIANGTADHNNGGGSSNTRGIHLYQDSNDDKSIGLWFTTGGHLSGISGQRSNSGSHWGTDLRFYTHTGNTSNVTQAYERVRISDDGLVGIGTETPADTNGFTNALDISGSSGSAVYVRTAGGGTAFGLLGHYGTTLHLRNESAGDLKLSTNATERLRITSGGNVNIGGDYAQTDSKVTIVDVSRPIAEATLNLQSSTTSGAANTGPVLRFYGHSGSEGRYHASIKGAKENGTSGNTAGYLAFNTRPAGGAMAERLRIDSAGRLLVGTTSAEDSAIIQSNGVSPASFYRASGSGGPNVSLKRSRGNLPTVYTVVQNNDNLGAINFVGTDGSAYVEGAKIFAEVSGTPGSNNMPTRLIFATNGGTTSTSERLRIESAGGHRIKCSESWTAANLAECNTTKLALNINQTRQGQTKGIALGSIGPSGGSTGIQAYDTSNDSANSLLINPFGGNVGLNATAPYYILHMKFSNAATSLSGGSEGNWGSDGVRIENTNTTVGSMALAHFRNYDADWHIGSKRVASNNSSFIFSSEGSTKVQIDNGGRVKIGDIADPEAVQTDCPVYIDMHSDISSYNTAEGAANYGFVRLEETGSNNGRYHGIELRNRNSGDIRIMNLDVSTSDRGDLVFAMPDEGASLGLSVKTRFNSMKGSLQIAGKGGAVLANNGTEHVDVYISTKTQLTGVESGAGAEIAGLIRFEDKGGTNSRYHGLELRNRNSGDARILNLDEGTTNKSNMVFAVDNGSTLIEAMKLHSLGYVTTPLQPSFCAYKNGNFSFTSNSNTVIKPWTEHHDTHSDFDPTSGIFTAPVAGKYFFYVTVMQQRQGNGDFQLKIYKNGNLYVNSNDMNDPATTTFQQTTVNGIVDLAANDTASFVVRNSTDTSSFLYNGHYTHCGGYLIG